MRKISNGEKFGPCVFVLVEIGKHIIGNRRALKLTCDASRKSEKISQRTVLRILVS